MSGHPGVVVHHDAVDACRQLAAEIAAGIRQRAAEGKRLVLGLATGSTPIPLYGELIRLHREEGLSFANVVTFNLDEYQGLPADHEQSYHTFMRRRFFSQVDLPLHQAHLPGSMVAAEELQSHCAAYEEAIEDAGGIDLQILGIGRSGHIGFNEPPSSVDTVTRLVSLDPITRRDAADLFGGLDQVPMKAITMGVGTILRSRRIALLAWGEGKASIIARALRESPSDDCPATHLHHHPNVTFILDVAASSQLNGSQ
ncbi:6-phosphogluconolactonase [Haloferula sp.]|uniref:6-phosphogluconolactonase n=1 Tax=Haloferula sp. TaxID=2497595 RepID=UPI003C77B4B2